MNVALAKLLIALTEVGPTGLRAMEWLQRSGVSNCDYYEARYFAVAQGYVVRGADSRFRRTGKAIDVKAIAAAQLRAAPSPLRVIRAELLEIMLQHRGRLTLDDVLAAMGANNEPTSGWTRAEVLRAIDDCVRRGTLTLRHGPGLHVVACRPAADERT